MNAVRTIAVAIFLALQTIPGSIHGDILLDPTELSPTNTLIDFEAFSPGATTNPLVIGVAKFSSVAIQLSVEDVSGYNPNSLVFRNLLRANDGPLFSTTYEDIRIDFSTPVGEIGLGIWDSTYTNNSLDVYDSLDNLLESATFPGGATGGGLAFFRGIRRSSNDIAYARVNIHLGNEIIGIDNVSYGFVTVPEPSGLMVASGIMALAFRRRWTGRCV